MALSINQAIMGLFMAVPRLLHYIGTSPRLASVLIQLQRRRCLYNSSLIGMFVSSLF